jgi:site-specific DNA-methyltransferase (adenine-specific)
MIDLRCGDWREVLADVGEVDAVICDPPYGARTHQGHNAATKQILSATGQKTLNELSYSAWTPDNVREFVAWWSPRCTGWMCAMTSDDLIPAWREAYAAAGRLDFAPVGILTYHPRLLGDGPGSGLVYLMVSRPRSKRFQGGWSCPPWYGPYYPANADAGQHIGGKPSDLMRKIVTDYTRPGDLICDPCAGGATTLLAAYQTGRRAVGSELDPITYAKAKARLDRALAQPHLFDPGLAKPVQQRLGE